MLELHDICVAIESRTLLRNINLSIPRGEVHWLMGPNGAGKSSLVQAIIGHPKYQITRGELSWDSAAITHATAVERAALGVFASFQAPISIPGVSTFTFLQAIVEQRLLTEAKTVSIDYVCDHIRAEANALGITDEMLLRPLNANFSGGEKKRCELLQFVLLEPQLAIFDELDAGLDHNSLQLFEDRLRTFQQKGGTALIITHTGGLLSTFPPDRVHVMDAGQIIRAGDAGLATQILAHGYTTHMLDHTIPL